MAKHSDERIIDRHERRRLVPISDVHVLRLERAGLFPERVKLGPSRVGWLLSEVLDWIEQRKSQRHLLGEDREMRYAHREPQPR